MVGNMRNWNTVACLVAALCLVTMYAEYVRRYNSVTETYINLKKFLKFRRGVLNQFDMADTAQRNARTSGGGAEGNGGGDRDSRFLINRLKRTIVDEMRMSADKLCYLKNVVETSINIPSADFKDLENVLEDRMFDAPSVEVENLKNGSVGGTYLHPDGTEVSEESDYMDDDQECPVLTWMPEQFERKSSIMGYLILMIKEYNKEIVSLNTLKTGLSEYLDTMHRIFSESLDIHLIGMCSTCASADCQQVFCNRTNAPLELQKKRNVDHIEHKSRALKQMICDFMQKYRYVLDLHAAIVEYNEKLERSWKHKGNEIQLTLNTRGGNGGRATTV